MKEYNDKEFIAEVLRRSRWTKKEHNEWLWKKIKNFNPRFNEEDVELYVNKLNEVKKC